MKNKGPTIYAIFFIIAIELLASGFVVNALVYICSRMHSSKPDISWIFVVFFCIISLVFLGMGICCLLCPTREWIAFPKRRIILALW